MKVSYYELLGMIENGNIPKEVYLCMCEVKEKYEAIFDGCDFNYYKRLDEVLSEDFDDYLRDSLLDSESFEKIIEIIEEPKKIEKLSYQQIGGYDNDLIRIIKDINKQISQIGGKLNETIEVVNELKGAV